MWLNLSHGVSTASSTAMLSNTLLFLVCSSSWLCILSLTQTVKRACSITDPRCFHFYMCMLFINNLPLIMINTEVLIESTCSGLNLPQR